MRTVNITNKEIPITGEYDVLVAGGGLGGIAAALSAARNGAKTAILEKNNYLGGVATAGMCCSVFNCLRTESGNIAIDGIPLEIVNALAERAGGPGKSWKNHRGHIIYDIEQAKLVLSEILQDAGVTQLLGMTVCDALTENGKVCGVIAAGRNGLEAIKAKNTVDATGDSTVAYLAGAEVEYALNGQSYVFRIGGVELDKFVGYFKEHPEEYPSKIDVNWSFEDAIRQYEENGTFLFPHGGGFHNSIVKKAIEDGTLKTEYLSHTHVCAMQMHGIRDKGVLHIITGFTNLESLSSENITKAIVDGRKMSNHLVNFFRERMPGFEKAYLSQGADDLGIRNSRRVKTCFEFTKDMRETPSRFEDAIGCGIVEQHRVLHAEKGAWQVQILTDEKYRIPLRAILPEGISGLIVGTGRSITPILRVMVTTMIIGQAAGTAAAVASKAGIPVETADVKKIQQALKEQGVNL